MRLCQGGSPTRGRGHNRLNEARGVLAKRNAFQLQLFGAAVAEFRQIALHLRHDRGMPRQRRQPRLPQRFGEARRRRHLPDPADALRGFGRDDVALTDHQVIVQGQPGRPQPFPHQIARGAKGDHAKEIIDQRRVPAVQKRALDPPVFRRERGGPGGVGVQPAVQRGIEPPVKPRPGSGQAQPLPEQIATNPGQFQIFPDPRHSARRGRADGIGHLGGHRRGHAHHGFHIGAVQRKTGQERQRPVPVDQIVIDPPVHPAEHIAKDRGIGGDGGLRHPQERHKGDVNAGIDMNGKGIGQRADHAGIAFDDVGIVKDGQGRIGLRCGQQRRGDRA